MRALEHDGLTALYSRHRRLRVRPRPELVLTHERVVEMAMARGTVLPLRFGTQLEHEEDLVRALSQRRERLLRGLDRVRGRVELGLRVFLIDQQRPRRQTPELTGREYLLGRVADHRGGELAARDLHTPLASLAEDSVVRRPTAGAVFVASYLVAAETADTFRARAGELSAGRRDIDVLITGPWPPYSFAENSDEA